MRCSMAWRRARTSISRSSPTISAIPARPAIHSLRIGWPIWPTMPPRSPLLPRSSPCLPRARALLPALVGCGTVVPHIRSAPRHRPDLRGIRRRRRSTSATSSAASLSVSCAARSPGRGLGDRQAPRSPVAVRVRLGRRAVRPRPHIHAWFGACLSLGSGYGDRVTTVVRPRSACSAIDVAGRRPVTVVYWSSTYCSPRSARPRTMLGCPCPRRAGP